MSNTITICNNEIQIKEFDNQRVVTFKEIDLIHGRPDGTAKRNFNTNKEYFIEGVDYFKVCASEIRTNKIMDISSRTHRDIILIAESGYLMLVKSFTDDLAWDVQRQLVNTYFNQRNISAKSDVIVFKSAQPTKLLGGTTTVRVKAQRYNKMVDLADISGKSLTDISSELIDFALNHVVVE